MTKKKLTSKQEKFVQEYCIHGNATRSAIAAGYSEKSAHAIGEENLRKLEIKAAIEKHKAQFAERCAVTLESLTEELNEALLMARSQDDSNALRQAVMAKAKLHGFDVIKTENKHSFEDMIDDL